MKNVLTSTLSVLPEGIGTMISFVMFLVMDFFHLMQEHVYGLVVVACISLIICLCMKKSKVKRAIVWFAIILLALSFGSILYSKISLRSSSKAELISDATESIIEDYYDMLDHPKQEIDWVLEAIPQKNVTFILVPVNTDLNIFLKDVFNQSLIQNETPNQQQYTYKARWSEIRQNRILVKSSYNLIWAYAPHLRKDWNHNGAVVLPESSYLVLEGMCELRNKNWEAGRTLLEKADSLGNAAGAFYLSTWYGAGLNQDPNHDKVLFYLAKAAKMGSRQARTNFGKMLLNNEESFSRRGEGIGYLIKASMLNTVATSITVNKTEEALFAMNEYYLKLGRYRDAYYLTKNSITTSNIPNVRFIAHLDNCIGFKKYSEARELIEVGKVFDDPHCIVVQAGMYTHGLGEKKDYAIAEELLRFAADSLDYYPAYKGMEELYKETGREGAKFWADLYKIKFSNRVKQTNYE